VNTETSLPQREEGVKRGSFRLQQAEASEARFWLEEWRQESERRVRRDLERRGSIEGRHVR